MNRVDRLFAILLLLQRKKRMRAIDLARAFEVSERTIYRDIAALNEGGVPIVSLPGAGYELVEGFYLPPLLFTQPQARALYLACHLLMAHTTGRLPADAEQALTKIALILPPLLREELDRLAEVIQFVRPAVPFDLDEPRLALLRSAIRERRVLRMRYHSQSRGQVTEREIEPSRLFYHDGVWYIQGYCRLRCAEREFRLSRIVELTLLDVLFQPRTPEQPAPQQITARIRFEPEVLPWVRERQHYGFQSEVPNDAGGSVMVYQVETLAELLPWLLSWGSAAVPLEPPELRARLYQEARTLLQRLGQPEPAASAGVPDS